MGFELKFIPPGPVAHRFFLSRAPLHGIMGPIGSGKTSTAIIKLAFLARLQRKSALDGVRRIKVGVIRDTYRNLQKTTLPSWFQWFPRSMGAFTGGDNAPPIHQIAFEEPTAGRIELTTEFIGLGENRVEDAMRGWEGTWIWLNEADRLAPEVLAYVQGRVGRFPKAIEGGATDDSGNPLYGVMADFNSPDTENYLYSAFVENPVPGTEFFRQPGGRSPGAENLQNLPRGYYERASSGQPDWYIRRFIDNEWGYSREGKPVYPEYNDQLHCAPDRLAPTRGLPLIIGMDAGLTPAAIIMQRDRFGQWRVLEEFCVASGEQMGAASFADRINLRLAEEPYRTHLADLIRYQMTDTPICGWADPAAGAISPTDERSWVAAVKSKLAIPIRLAPSNRPQPRQEAVRLPLTRMVDGRPGFLLSPSCKVLRKGFNSHYRLRRIQLAGEHRYHEEPEKNEYSHPHDALQYGMLGGGEYSEVMGRTDRIRSRQAQDALEAAGASDYDPLAW